MTNFWTHSALNHRLYLYLIYGLPLWKIVYQAKEKYRGVFEIQKSGDKTSSGEISLDIRTHASPKVGQDQVSGGVSVPCRHATPVADALWKPIFSNYVKVGKKSSQGKVSYINKYGYYISTNMDTTNIFPFLAIFSTKFEYFTPKIAIIFTYSHWHHS